MLTLVEIFEGNIAFYIVYCIELMYQDLPLRILQENSTIIFLNAILARQFIHSVWLSHTYMTKKIDRIL